MVSIDQHDANGDWIRGENQDFTIEAGAKWTRFDVTIRGFHRDAAGIAIFLRPVLWTESGNLTGTAWFDDVRFEERKIVDEVRGKWIRREGAVRIWQSPVEQKVRRDDSLGSGADDVTTVEIAAACGEIEPFQIVIQPGAGGALARAAPSALAGPGGSRIDSRSITIREVSLAHPQTSS